MTSQQTIETRYEQLMQEYDSETVRADLIKIFGAQPVIKFLMKRALDHQKWVEEHERQSTMGDY